MVKQTETNIAQCNEGTVLEQDGYHLTTKGGQLVANLIANGAQEAIRGQRTSETQAESQYEPQAEPQAESQNKKTQTIIIPPGIGRHVVAKKGKIITEIKSRNNVEIHTGTPNDLDETLIAITGKEKLVTQAINEINDIIEQHLERQKEQKERQQERTGTVCRHFMKGSCRYGSGCWQLHPTVVKSSSPETHREIGKNFNPENHHETGENHHETGERREKVEHHIRNTDNP